MDLWDRIGRPSYTPFHLSLDLPPPTPPFSFRLLRPLISFSLLSLVSSLSHAPSFSLSPFLLALSICFPIQPLCLYYHPIHLHTFLDDLLTMPPFSLFFLPTRHERKDRNGKQRGKGAAARRRSCRDGVAPLSKLEASPKHPPTPCFSLPSLLFFASPSTVRVSPLLAERAQEARLS